jgi:hypothetical protein
MKTARRNRQKPLIAPMLSSTTASSLVSGIADLAFFVFLEEIFSSGFCRIIGGLGFDGLTGFASTILDGLSSVFSSWSSRSSSSSKFFNFLEGCLLLLTLTF